MRYFITLMRRWVNQIVSSTVMFFQRSPDEGRQGSSWLRNLPVTSTHPCPQTFQVFNQSHLTPPTHTSARSDASKSISDKAFASLRASAQRCFSNQARSDGSTTNSAFSYLLILPFLLLLGCGEPPPRLSKVTFASSIAQNSTAPKRIIEEEDPNYKPRERSITKSEPPAPVKDEPITPLGPPDNEKPEPPITPKVLERVETVLVPTLRVQLDHGLYFEKTPETNDYVKFPLQDRLATIGDGLLPGVGAWAVVPRQSMIVQQHRPKTPDKRVVIEGVVTAARKGFIEQFLTVGFAGKDYESILTSPISDAQNLHIALSAAGAQSGKPATFVNAKREYDFKPATGSPLEVLVEYYTPENKRELVPAQTLIMDGKGNMMKAFWVFAGSYMGRGPHRDDETKMVTYYAANSGRVICVTNFPDALLDLNIESKDGNPQESLDFRANPQTIPSVGVPVRVIIYPREGK